MPTQTAEHDKLAYRLTQILVKLNQGEKLNPQALAEEFNVNLRTIQRDLNSRFAYLPIEKDDGRYGLAPTYLGKLNLRDIERFACLAGVSGLFPSLSTDFLRDIFDSRLQTALLIRGHNYEDLQGKEDQFKQLEQAIKTHTCISFNYSKTGGVKTYNAAQPYKLVNQDGIWYLAAKDGKTLKAFSFGKISYLQLQSANFKPEASVNQTLSEEDSIWLNTDKTEVVLQVTRDAASYFKRRKLIAGQVIEKELEDGGLIVSGKVAHANQILPIVRYWLPNIKLSTLKSCKKTWSNS